MPAAIAFCEKYKDHRDKFEIFAFHSASAKSFEVLDAKMKRIIERRWGGKKLPFPILLDSTGESLRRFSIKALGTHVLIGPNGKVVKGDGLRTLEAELKKLIEQSNKLPRARGSSTRGSSARGAEKQGKGPDNKGPGNKGPGNKGNREHE